MRRDRRLKSVSLVLFFVVSLPLHSEMVRAANTTSDRNAQTTFRFDIPAGPLDTVLASFQQVTGLSATIAASLATTGPVIQSPGVSGTYTADQALERLLAGTGLARRLSGPNAYVIDVRVSENVQVRGRISDLDAASVTATKTLTPLRDVPQSVTVIGRDVIADQSMQSMADVVRYVPGVGMGQGEGNRDTPILRGNSTTADFFVDGVRDDVQYFRDLYNLERVEALKGPNAMIFGRGGAGGVINRATRLADWRSTREVLFQTGSDANRRVSFDLGQPIHRTFAARMTGVYENSDSYRHDVGLERYGLNPSVAFSVGNSTTVRLSYERFHDDRTADRGIPSFGDRPVQTAPSTFFGDPAQSNTFATVNAATAAVDHTMGRFIVRNRTRFADYDKFYQNVYPGSAVSADGTSVSLAAYNNATQRANLFNQTDVTTTALTGSIKHVLAAGAELGRQATDNLRNTGYFTSIGPTTTTFTVPVSAPTVSVPVTFRPSATDADNNGVATVAAVYGQDQMEWGEHVQTVVGVRYDRFNVDFHNNRTGAELRSTDNLLSPRVGLIFKPAEPVSFYSSYSLTYVPRAGEQLASLSLTNQSLDPEKFTNYEVGVKWDLRPELSATAAVYQLNRTNVVVPDPLDATRSILVDGQRTRGVELGLTGRLTRSWSAIGGYAFQDAVITRTLSSTARSGAALAQVPRHSFSLWNRYDITPRWAVAAGIIHNDDVFTSTDNTVVLPSFTRLDGALFVRLTRSVSGQINVENVFNDQYYAFANGNNNITPGSPRAVRVGVTTRF